MVRRSTLLHVGSLTTATLVTLAMGVTCAGAASSRHHQRSKIIQNTIAGPPVMAIVSIKDQRVSLYDANGGALRARVSTGRTDYETPVGIYSVLEKQQEHYSNVYDDASMPFMQRITWSGLSLHGGVLPGYPASHGCVRMPNDFAEQIFPLTKIGMRVIVAHDDVAPVEISHPLLLKPPPAVKSARATSVSYDAQGPDPENGSPFEPNVRNWPTRQAQLQALKAIAADKSAEADAAIAHADELSRVAAMKSSQRGKAAKAVHIAELAKRARRRESHASGARTDRRQVSGGDEALGRREGKGCRRDNRRRCKAGRSEGEVAVGGRGTRARKTSVGSRRDSEGCCRERSARSEKQNATRFPAHKPEDAAALRSPGA